jgi:uncharacterized membrane-anchored protein
MRKLFLLALILLIIPKIIFSKNPPEDSSKIILEMLQKRIDSVESKLNYKTGTVVLSNNMATVNVPVNFKFLGPDDAEYIITEIWGNPKGNKPLGMIVPADQAASMSAYAFIIEYDDIGYVKDKDADKINYDDLLKDIKESQVKSNEERRRLGLETMEIVGWASKPYYDKERKVLHWAKEFKVEGADENTLNYDIRVLGRKGVLNLQAVSGISSLDSVKAHINDVLGMVAFNEGHQYSDFNSNTDKVAAWTIGGLVAGKILAKAGLWAVLAKFFKFIIIGIVAAGGAIWRFITGRKKQNDEMVYQPQPVNEEIPPANS